MEDTWLKSEREYFVRTQYGKVGIPAKQLNKALEDYNKYLQKALLGEYSPFVAEDLKQTILHGGNSDREEDRQPRESDSEA